MAKGGDGRPKKADLAATFLLHALSGGEKPSEQVKKEARQQGISHRALWEAKEELNVQARKSTFSGSWFWKLPASEE
jgi:outer membrane biogenesis lipoprotein LolB